MKTFLTTLTLLLTQLLSAQVFTQVDEIAVFPGCENSFDKSTCNQMQLLILSNTAGQMAQVELTIDGNGSINRWQTISSDNMDIKVQVDNIMNELKSRIKLTPARIGGEPVNYEMRMMVPVIVN